MLLSVAKDVYLSNFSKTIYNTLHTEIRIFLTVLYLSIIIFFENSFSNAPGLLFIFVCISTGHAHFPNNEICIPWIPMRLSMIVFGCRILEKLISRPRILNRC